MIVNLNLYKHTISLRNMDFDQQQRNKIAINLSHSRYPSKQSQLRNSDQHTSTIIQSLYENESLRATPTHDEKKREKRQAFEQNH